MSDADDVWARMLSIYEGFQAGRADDVDSVLAENVTLWDSAEFPLVHGLAELAELRARRPSGEGAAVAVIKATDPVIDVWGDTALVRHLLRVEFAGDAEPEIVRNTSVWRRVDGQWYAVHNHEDVAGGGQRPAD